MFPSIWAKIKNIILIIITNIWHADSGQCSGTQEEPGTIYMMSLLVHSFESNVCIIPALQTTPAVI